MAIEQHIESLCESLPEGWSVRIEIERGCGEVIAVRPNGTEVAMSDGENDIEDQLMAAYFLARDEEAMAALDLKELKDAANPRLQGEQNRSDSR